MVRLVILLSLLLSPSTATKEQTYAMLRQEFQFQGETATELSTKQQLGFEKTVQSYLTGTTCDVVAQEIVVAEATDYILQLDYECLFQGSSMLAKAYYRFIREQLELVTEDLAALGVIESFAPILLQVGDGAKGGDTTSTEAGVAANVSASYLTVADGGNLVTRASPATISTAASSAAIDVPPGRDKAPNAPGQTERSAFRQGFVLAADSSIPNKLTDKQELLLAMQMDAFAANVVESGVDVRTKCVITDQTIVEAAAGSDENVILVDSVCTWTSSKDDADVSQFPRLFITYVNSNLDTVTKDLRSIGLTMIERALPFEDGTVASPAPTPGPSVTPKQNTVTGSYAQQLVLAELPTAALSDAAKNELATIFARYTVHLVDDAANVETICDIKDANVTQDELMQVFMNLQYNCTYTSLLDVVKKLPALFVKLVNANLVIVTQDLKAFGVVEALPVREADASLPIPIRGDKVESTSAPSTSPVTSPTIAKGTARAADDEKLEGMTEDVQEDIAGNLTEALQASIKGDKVESTSATLPTIAKGPASVAGGSDVVQGRGFYRQEFEIPSGSYFFTNEEELVFVELIEEYAANFAPDSSTMATTECRVDKQKVRTDADGTTTVLTLEYSCVYTAPLVDYAATTEDPSAYPHLFTSYMNENRTKVTADMAEFGLHVTAAGPVESMVKFPSRDEP